MNRHSRLEGPVSGALALVSIIFLGSAALLAGCASSDPYKMQTPSVSMNLDSLHQVNQHEDSVESNLIFYEHAFEEYKTAFPAVDKPSFMRIAQGKDQEFCLFKKNPAQTCLEVADKFNDLGLKQPARDAYEAGLLSEGANTEKINIRLWASMGQIHFEEKEYELGKPYLIKVLEVDRKNKWAKKLLASAPKEKS